MSTLFISDLHLEDGRPETTALLTKFLQGPASKADAVYILGDLFEFWIGDDVLSETARRVAPSIADLGRCNIPCYFLHGNRDFLLGPGYAALAGFQLLPETLVVNLYDTPTLLLHGDTLCTDDIDYQNFRQQVRTPRFAETFLDMSPEQRFQMARDARDASQQHTGSLATDIMDVNEMAVRRAFFEHRVQRMIHGHTHRPAFHRHPLGAEGYGDRIVLSDWHTTGSYLQVTADGCEMLTVSA